MFQGPAIIRIIRKRPEGPHLRQGALATGSDAAMKAPVGPFQAGALENVRRNRLRYDRRQMKRLERLDIGRGKGGRTRTLITDCLC